MFNFKVLIILLIFSSCSSLTENIIKKDNFKIKNGRFNNLSWNDSTVFRRSSWYKELTLMFDLYLQKIDSNSPFFNWYSESEQEKIKSCEESYIGISYSIDSKKVSQALFYSEMEKNGFENFPVRGFKDHLKVHPIFDKKNMKLYKINGFCLVDKSKYSSQSLIVNFPGFSSTKVN